GIERRASAKQLEVVLRSRQRRQAEELQQVNRQLPLDDVDVPQNGIDCIVRKAKDIPGVGDDARSLPGQQHRPVFSDPVLALFGARQIIRIDVLEPDEDAPHAGLGAFLYEIRQLVAERIDLNNEADMEILYLPQMYEAIENGFPI